MKQQTAVSFLLRELRIEDLAKGEQLSVVLQICEQAKQIEKEQIAEAYLQGSFDDGPNQDNAEQYYNEQYGQGSPDTNTSPTE